MRLQVLAVGRLKSGPERELVERYRGRIDGLARSLGVSPVDIVEIAEGRARSAGERRLAEGKVILGRAEGVKLVALDERAPSVSSQGFAERVAGWRDSGASAAFAIGGPDGLDEEVRRRADLSLSFGRLTLPHQLVRVLLLEQIYRALTILAGHPYHREGESG